MADTKSNNIKWQTPTIYKNTMAEKLVGITGTILEKITLGP
jgi:hypothetical protein